MFYMFHKDQIVYKMTISFCNHQLQKENFHFSHYILIEDTRGSPIGLSEYHSKNKKINIFFQNPLQSGH